MNTLTGQSIGRYHVLEQLGEGGMATVYKAYDTRLERDVAIKIIHPRDQHSRKLLKRFEREAKALAQLSHPNIVKVLDYGEHDGIPYIVMEYIPSGTLKEKIGRPWPWKQAAKLILPIAQALEYAHQRNIIHRDVKPSNILITASGQVMLSDFGIAKLLELEETTDLTGTSVGVGTPEYMAPEQGIGDLIDQRADIYALGVVFYELITGRRPFQADTPMAVLVKQIYDPLPRPKSIVSDLPRSIERVLFKALAKEPEHRFRTMGDFSLVLKQVAQGEKPKLKRSIQLSRAKTILKSSKKGWVAGILAALFFIGLILILNNRRTSMVTKDVAVLFPPSPTSISINTSTNTITPSIIPSSTPTPTATSTFTPKPTNTPTPILPVRSGTLLPKPLATISPSNAAGVKELARWGKSLIYEVAWSPDGKELAVAFSSAIYLYDSSNLENPRIINTDTTVKSLVFSPDGNILSSGMNDGKIILWHVIDKKRLQTLEEYNEPVVDLAFSPDGTILVAGVGNGQIKLWGVNSNELLHTLDLNTEMECLAFSPDGTTLAFGLADSTVILWDAVSGRELRTLKNDGMLGVNSIAFSPDGTKLVSGSNDGTIRLWQVDDSKLLLTLEGHENLISSVVFSPNGTILASGSKDGTIRLWSIAEGELLHAMQGVTEIVGNVVFTPDGTELSSITADGTMKLWDVASGRHLKSLDLNEDGSDQLGRVRALAISQDGETLASLSWDEKMILWEIQSGRELNSHEINNFSESSMIFTPNGEALAALGLYDGTVKLLNALNGSEIHTLDAHLIRVEALEFSVDGSILISASGNAVKLWDVASGKRLETVYGESTDEVESVALSPDGNTLAFGTYDGEVWLWDLTEEEIAHVFEGHTYPVFSIDFSPDGQILASGARDGTVRFWDTLDGDLLQMGEKYKGNRSLVGTIYDIAFSPKGDVVASASRDNLVQLWDVATGELLSNLEGHLSSVYDVAFSQNGSILFSGSRDGTIRLWGVWNP